MDAGGRPVLAAAVVVTMTAFYAVRRRWVVIGLLLCSAGIVPGAILERNILTALTDPAVDVHADTYVLFGVALAIPHRRPRRAGRDGCRSTAPRASPPTVAALTVSRAAA